MGSLMAMRHFFLVVNLTFAIFPLRGINAFMTTTTTTTMMKRTTASGSVVVGRRATGTTTTTSTSMMSDSATTTTTPTTTTTAPPPPQLYLAEGLLAVRKPLTWTSNDVVSYVRGVLIKDAKDRGVTEDDRAGGDGDGNGRRKKKWSGRRRNQLMKVGHGGTLDPLASGVLVLGVGKGTTMLQSYLEGDKRYVATVQLGYETDTLDSEGRIVKTAPWEHVTDVDAVGSAISAKFTGRIRQVPPLYSAVRVDGERLYNIARGNAEPGGASAKDVEIPTREVEIYGLRVHGTLEEEVIRSGMVDGPRYREEAKVMEDLADAAAATAIATATAAAAHAVAGDGGDDDRNDDRVGGVDNEGGGGGGGGGRKRKRAGTTTAKNRNDRNKNKKDLFDEVTVPSVRPDDVDLELPRFALSVECGGGTYIRSLVRDIGYELDTVATMTGLVRTKQGPFVLGDALPKENWTADGIYDAIRRSRERHNIGSAAVLNVRGGGEAQEEGETTAPAPIPALASFYPIGIPGKPWTDVERSQWKSGTKVQRSYKEEVLDALDRLDGDVWEVVRYGALSHDPGRYPLFGVKSRNWRGDKPCLLITGGVHGYETSGVQGAMLFLQSRGKEYSEDVNIFVAPCVSPWAYEHVQRWNAASKDVNRSFKEGSETEESKALMSYLEALDVTTWACHVDLHETTDTDASEFMPAKHAEAGLMYEAEAIPDGFYLACDSENSQLEFQEAIIASVRDVTHIAPPDDDGNIIGVPVVKDGVILLPAKTLGLCCSATGAKYSTTTEVYPDSPRATDEICNRAQVAAIVGALDYVLSHNV